MKIKTIHTVANILRNLKLLRFADWVYYVKHLFSSREANRTFLSAHPAFPVPPAHLAFDALGFTDWKLYFETGRNDSAAIADILNREIQTDRIRLLEWGCGPGRIIRHMRSVIRHDHVELCGTDYNPNSINWCRDNLKGIEFFNNQLEPPFPPEIGLFDCVYAISVFTHLSEAMHFAWIKEIRNVLKPNGLLLMTTHSDSASDRLLRHEKQLYDSGGLVVRANVSEGKKWFLAYHPPKFIMGPFLDAFEIVSHDRFNDTQDIWVAKKRG